MSNKFFSSYFFYTKKEKSGIQVLLLLILVLLVLLFINREKRTEVVLTKEENLISDAPISQTDETQNKIEKKKNFSTELFDFDPNGLSVEDWQRLGLSIKQAEVIKRFEKKGGRFYRASDLKKMYTISEKKYNEIQPYIKIKETVSSIEKVKSIEIRDYPKFEKKLVILDLNSCDTNQLMSLRGIGPVLSKRIIRYRELLGGYREMAQLGEVYGLDSSLIKTLLPQLKIGSERTERIKLSETDIAQLARHPYINYNLSRAICNYFKTHTQMINIDELKNIAIIDSVTYSRIEPYLSIN